MEEGLEYEAQVEAELEAKDMELFETKAALKRLHLEHERQHGKSHPASPLSLSIGRNEARSRDRP